MRTTDPVFNVTFVGIIEKHPCLYALDSSNYNNRAVQEKAWESVANEVRESVFDCKERWKNIRGCYTRYLKSLNSPGNGGKKQPYYLVEPLHFLQQYTKSRKSLEYFSDTSMLSLEPTVKLEENGEHRDDDGSASLSQDAFIYDQEPSPDVRADHDFAQPPQKRVRHSRENVPDVSYDRGTDHVEYLTNKELREEKKTEESDLAFLTSLLTDMKEMNRNQKRKFKIAILDLAGSILNEQQPCPDSLSSSGSSSPAVNHKAD